MRGTGAASWWHRAGEGGVCEQDALLHGPHTFSMLDSEPFKDEILCVYMHEVTAVVQLAIEITVLV